MTSDQLSGGNPRLPGGLVPIGDPEPRWIGPPANAARGVATTDDRISMANAIRRAPLPTPPQLPGQAESVKPRLQNHWTLRSAPAANRAQQIGPITGRTVGEVNLSTVRVSPRQRKHRPGCCCLRSAHSPVCWRNSAGAG